MTAKGVSLHAYQPSSFYSIPHLFSGLYLNQQCADLPLSFLLHIISTSDCRSGWNIFAAEPCFAGTLMMAELDMKHKTCATPAAVPRFDTFLGEVESYMFMSLIQDDVFADQPVQSCLCCDRAGSNVHMWGTVDKKSN